MKTMNKTPKYWLAVMAMAFSASTLAHDAWIEPRGNDYAVIYGHEGKVEGYPPAKVQAIAALDVQGETLPIKKTETADAVTFSVTGKPAVLTLYYDNGFWTKTTTGSKNAAKNEVSNPLSSSHIVKFSKTVLNWGPGAAKPQNQRLEIVPLTENAPVTGKTLPVQVLWDGKPLSGAKIGLTESNAEGAVTTDAQGKAALPVIAGHQLFSTSHKVALKGDARADSYSATANLIFNTH